MVVEVFYQASNTHKMKYFEIYQKYIYPSQDNLLYHKLYIFLKNYGLNLKIYISKF